MKNTVTRVDTLSGRSYLLNHDSTAVCRLYHDGRLGDWERVHELCLRLREPMVVILDGDDKIVTTDVTDIFVVEAL
jgi:hypothetical protein